LEIIGIFFAASLGSKQFAAGRVAVRIRPRTTKNRKFSKMFLREKMFLGKKCFLEKCSLEKCSLEKMFFGLIAAGRVAVRLRPRFSGFVEQKICRRQE
jgi:hypothetical protein